MSENKIEVRQALGENECSRARRGHTEGSEALNNQESCGGRKSGAFQKKGEGGNIIPGQGESIFRGAAGRSNVTGWGG